MKAVWLGLLLLVAGLADAAAGEMVRCMLNGSVVIKEAPCQVPNAGERAAQQAKIEAYHRQLDQLLAAGAGKTRPQKVDPPPPQRAAEDDTPQYFQTMPRAQRRAKYRADAAAATERATAQARENNAANAVRLTAMLDEAKAACGGRLFDMPKLGMSDREFRECTTFSRFNPVQEVVAAHDGPLQLRLYVFSTAHPSRVYSVDGVITALKD